VWSYVLAKFDHAHPVYNAIVLRLGRIISGGSRLAVVVVT